MNITPDNLLEAHQQCIADIEAYDYFQHVYARLYEIYETYGDPKDLTEPSTICEFWNDFWMRLPDHMAIHRQPFFLICDLAEGSYIEEDEQ